MSIWSRLRRTAAVLFNTDRLLPPIPGPSRITDGKIPADQSFRRLPLVVWGDVFPNGDFPQVRRALAGADAHECMYTWVYISELVTVRDMAGAAARETFAPAGSAAELTDRFDRLKAATDDAQNQLSRELLDVFLPVAQFIAAAGAETVEYVELGSTFFVSIEKIDICSRLLGVPLDCKQLQFSGIEYSPFLTRAAKTFHPHDAIAIVKEPHDWSRSRTNAFHISRFVGSYAFRSTAAFAEEIARCDAFHIIDAFNLAEDDFHSWDLGLPITFMNLPLMVERLTAAGFDVYVTKVDAEFHAAGRQKAMVARLFGIRRETASRIGFFERYDALGGFEGISKARKMDAAAARAVIAEIDASLTPEQWEAFAEYKKFFPIWSGPPGLSKSDVAAMVSSADLGMNLRFDDGQPARIVRDALRNRSWNPG
jgi:hypothetical protein